MAAPARNHRGPPCEARVGSAVRLASIRITLGGLSLLPDLEKRDTTSPPSQIPSPRPSGSPVLPKSLMLTLLLRMVLLSWTTKTPVVLLVSIPIIILMKNLLVLCHKNLE